MSVETEQQDHGKSQAAAQASSVAEMVAALNCDYDRLAELKEARDDLQEAVREAEDDEIKQAAEALDAWVDENGDEIKELEEAAGDCEDRDEAVQRIQEDALSVEVRSGWQSLGEPLEAAEFRIVLCTGGPHVEMVGELDEHNEPSRAWLQYQDWGTSMTQFLGAEQATLLEYARQFYFGE